MIKLRHYNIQKQTINENSEMRLILPGFAKILQTWFKKLLKLCLIFIGGANVDLAQLALDQPIKDEPPKRQELRPNQNNQNSQNSKHNAQRHKFMP